MIAAPYLRSDESVGVAQAGFRRGLRSPASSRFWHSDRRYRGHCCSLVTGRGTVALWGYPLWLFLGLWIVLNAPPLRRAAFTRIVAAWGVVCAVISVGFAVHYGVQPRFGHRYIAVLFPGDRLGPGRRPQRYRAMTGQPLAYVIARMWDGGHAQLATRPERPRVLIDGDPRRAPWIDLGDHAARAPSAAVVWTSGDPRALPSEFRASSLDDAAVVRRILRPYALQAGTRQRGRAGRWPRPDGPGGMARVISLE